MGGGRTPLTDHVYDVYIYRLWMLWPCSMIHEVRVRRSENELWTRCIQYGDPIYCTRFRLMAV